MPVSIVDGFPSTFFLLALPVLYVPTRSALSCFLFHSDPDIVSWLSLYPTPHAPAAYSLRLSALLDEQLLAHPITQTWISDGDQLALSYLEAVSVSRIGGKGGEGTGDREGGTPRGGTGSEKCEEGVAEDQDDDDDMGFRVSFVSLVQYHSSEYRIAPGFCIRLVIMT